MSEFREQAIRQTGRRLVDWLVDPIHVKLRGMTDAELRMVKRRLQKLTTTNCGWDSYVLRYGLQEIIDSHQRSRKIERRKARAALKGD